MAKKKKRKHSGGRQPAYAEYLIKGEKLTKAQKRYNEEVRKAYRRMQSWKKKFEIDRKLDLLPTAPTTTGSTRAFKLSEQAVREVTWKNYESRIREVAEYDQLIRNLLGGISEVDEHVGYNDWWTEYDQARWLEFKMSYFHRMYNQVVDLRNQLGEEEFYRRFKDPETWREIVRASHELYEVMPSENSDVATAIERTEDQHEFIYESKFMTLLTNEPRSDEELRRRQDEADYVRMFYGGTTG